MSERKEVWAEIRNYLSPLKNLVTVLSEDSELEMEKYKVLLSKEVSTANASLESIMELIEHDENGEESLQGIIDEAAEKLSLLDGDGTSKLVMYRLKSELEVCSAILRRLESAEYKVGDLLLTTDCSLVVVTKVELSEDGENVKYKYNTLHAVGGTPIKFYLSTEDAVFYSGCRALASKVGHADIRGNQVMVNDKSFYSENLRDNQPPTN